MNWDQVQGKWKEVRGSVRQEWGKLTDNDLEEIAGHREKLIGKLQQRYGIQKEDAEKKINEWLKARTREFEHSHQK